MSIINDLKLEYKMGGITQRLIFWNVGLFAIPLIIFSILKLSGVDVSAVDWTSNFYNGDFFSLSSNPADLLWKPWSLLGYAFLHKGFLHILFNMLMLVFAARVFLTFFTQKQLFGIYVLSAIFAGLVYIAGYAFLPMLAGQITGMVGASAAIMAILIAAAIYAPYYNVRLLLIGTVKIWHVAIVFVVLDLINASVENSGGHIAHLAGAAFGFVYIKLLQNGTDLTIGVSRTLDFFGNLFKPKKKQPFTKVYRNTAPPTPKAAGMRSKNMTQQQIDDILDKISRSGYESLTKDEKDFLFKVGKN
ncbi:rhomboid family intramembrane serine protease [Flavobacterium sp. Sd200]|uniref:rhomboid family intramembrane serine protease n=1 Tax=Flavobacterium sp. Sd200 TaxID=2692211 RepID=UPI00136A892B|nr:rhomboid family intramembrane serine protease [Flavobacterium sp. Sd200]MXN92988.1 rhomboid family intramembrane serine protease [Flavobacterium sp. Sd200]